ncbi:tripeptidyl-peptidase II Tpp2 [Thoreauomyces humboldtii]|nr:tripeptidyl-peptidase II Tpp2 [Thoreauomyces humboldtii]
MLRFRPPAFPLSILRKVFTIQTQQRYLISCFASASYIGPGSNPLFKQRQQLREPLSQFTSTTTSFSTLAAIDIMPTSEFPINGLLPKEETQAASFIRKNPTFDGRGTVVAILDTGIDPGSPGMQVTSDGKPKLIDIIDCTGAGDVACSKIIEAEAGSSEDGKAVHKLLGLSGKTLILSASLTNPTGKFRLGLKHQIDLFPAGVHARLQKEKKKRFQTENNLLVTKVLRDLDTLEANSSIDKDEKELLKQDHKTRLEVLKELEKNWRDDAVIDCVVFHDGKTWRALVDTAGSGDLTEKKPLANYREELQYEQWDQESMLNYSVNIYDEGEILSIVTTCGPHGNHVAGIAAANYPEEPALNGVAPGAQLISLRIGNGRLGGMETGCGLVRAAIDLARLKPDLANISYGEASATPNHGRFVQLIRDEVVNAAPGCIVIAAAGNAGAALSTNGTPGATCNSIIGVGAYATREMMRAQYALLDQVPDIPHTWTSRGPASDGDIGVEIFAPGSAITTVPQSNLARSQLMNGTSMASPNFCGCASLLVSALKAEGVPYNPYRVKSAFRNSGKDVGDEANVPFVQVEKAWAHMTAFPDLQALNVNYDVKVTSGGKLGRGIYLRDIDETTEPQTSQVDVSPRFYNQDAPETNDQRIALDVRLTLRPSESWISSPEHVLFHNPGRGFAVRVDPTGLKPGAHHGRVDAFDTSNMDAGPIFSVPVTVCKLDGVPSARNSAETTPTPSFLSWRRLRFQPGQIRRQFVAVPVGASFAQLTVKSANRDSPARFIVHTMQLGKQTRRSVFEQQYGIELSRNGSAGADEQASTHTKLFRVLPYVTMEICLAQFWSSLGDSEVDVEVEFHGVNVAISSGNQSPAGFTNGSDLTLVNQAGGFARLDYWSALRTETVSASASLDTLRRYVRPSSYVVSALKSRDELPSARQLHQIVLTYTFAVAKGTGPVNVTPRVPRFNDLVYDNPIDSFELIIYDGNKKELQYADVYAKTVKVADGATYTVRVRLASTDTDLLEKLNATVLVIDQALAKPITLAAYQTLDAVVAEDSSLSFKKKTALPRGARTVAWLALDNVAVPKDAKPGDVLIGDLGVLGDRTVEGGLYKFGLVVAPLKAEKDATAAAATDKSEENEDEEKLIKEAVRDLEIQWIKKIKDDSARKTLVDRLVKEWPEHLPLHETILNQLGESAEKEEEKLVTAAAGKEKNDVQLPTETLASIETAAQRILTLVDEKLLRQDIGSRAPTDAADHLPPRTAAVKRATAKHNADIDVRKSAVVAAHGWLAWVKTRGNDGTQDPVPHLEALAVYIPSPPTKNPTYLVPWATHVASKGLHGAALKATGTWLAEGGNAGDRRWAAVTRIRAKSLASVGWEGWSERDRVRTIVDRPAEFSLF